MDPIVARSTLVRQRRPHARPRVAFSAAFVCAVLALPASADDLDVYRDRIAAQQKPNVLFVLDYSGSMGKGIDGRKAGRGNPARLELLKQAVTAVLDQNLDSVNAGIGSLYKDHASGARWPTGPLRGNASEHDASIPTGISSRDVIVGELGRLEAGGSTATVNALAEAAAYFKGDAVTNGDADPQESWAHRPDEWNVRRGQYAGGNWRAALPATYAPSEAYQRDAPYTGQFGWCTDYSASGGRDNCAAFRPADIISCSARDAGSWSDEGGEGSRKAREVCRYRHPDRWSGARYESPVGECRANAIILVSDGVPTKRHENASLSKALGLESSTAIPAGACEELGTSVFAETKETDDDGDCGPEIAHRLATTELLPGVADSTVKTYTIGFAIDGAGADYLARIATAGGGTSQRANNLDELTEALSEQLRDIGRLNENFAELAVDVDRENFAHENRAYFNLFEPSVSNAWSGNMKGYYLTRDGLKDSRGQPATVKADGVEVFAATAQSFWSNVIDGNDALLGGASEQITAPIGSTLEQIEDRAAARQIYTWLGAPANGTPIPLWGESDRTVSSTNTALSAALLGLPNGSSRREKLIQQLRRAPMGDALHSKSVGVRYPGRKIVYTMTNQGLLHAFDATTPIGEPADPAASDPASPADDAGEEIWAYMPKRLLANLPRLFDNANDGNHVYGLDGGITRWHDDGDGDGVVDDGERMLLIIGMRRGGDSYYALDVEDPEKPKLVWELDPRTAGFAQLGESWSRPSLVSAKSTGAPDGIERFLVFGGGYDAATLDGTEEPTPTTRGNALFVVDGDGQLVWSTAGRGISGMDYAIPADPAVIDSDADGLADRIYIGDLGGQIWRIDFDDARNAAQYDVNLFASLAGGKHRPFFYPPSVARQRAGGKTFLSISIGSGDRTDPMRATSDNAFFMLRDRDAGKGPPADSFAAIGDATLFNTTDNAIGSSDDTIASAARLAMAAAPGWRIELAPGEKSLSRLLSFEGKLLATTFEPGSDSVPGACGATPIGRFYLMDIATGRPLQFTDDGSPTDDMPDNAVRARALPINGIPSGPLVVFPEPGVAQIVVDKGSEIQFGQKLQRVFWHAR